MSGTTVFSPNTDIWNVVTYFCPTCKEGYKKNSGKPGYLQYKFRKPLEPPERYATEAGDVRKIHTTAMFGRTVSRDKKKSKKLKFG
jgi:hypothetical protein